MSLAHGWSRSFSGIVQSSFLRGYLITPVAVGTRVDFYGGEVVMGWGVALWSLATFLTPWAADTSLWALLATRAMLGIAEGVALPCVNNMIASLKGGKAKMLKKLYKPFLLDGSRRQNESGLLGLQWLDFNFGNAIGLTQSPILLSKGSIFGPFVIFGLSGFLWVLVWLSAISCTSDRSSQISEYELEYILNKEWKSFPMENKSKTRRIIPSFRRLLSKMLTWSLIVANTIHSWIYYVDLKHAAWFSAVPWRVMGFMGYFGGDPRHDSGVLRGTTNSVIYNEFGILNTAGTLAAIVGTVGAGFFAELVGSFHGFLMLTSLLYFLAALFNNIFSTGENEF